MGRLLGGAMLSLLLLTRVTAGSIILEPVMDSFVCSDQGQTNYGGAITLAVGGWSPGPGRCFAFLKFDLSAIPKDAAELAAALDLYCWVVESGGGGDYRIAYVEDDSWNEADITYDNAPPISELASEGRMVASDGTWNTWDISAMVREAIAGDGTLSVAVVHAGTERTLPTWQGWTDIVKFASKDGDWPLERSPRLNVSWSRINLSASWNVIFPLLAALFYKASHRTARSRKQHPGY